MKVKYSVLLMTGAALLIAGCQTNPNQMRAQQNAQAAPMINQALQTVSTDYQQYEVQQQRRYEQEQARKRAQAEAAAKERAARQAQINRRQAQEQKYTDKLRELELAKKELELKQYRSEVNKTVNSNEIETKLQTLDGQYEANQLQFQLKKQKEAHDNNQYYEPPQSKQMLIPVPMQK